MKIGMNLLLWTDFVEAEHDPILEQIKAIGFDAVEVPVFDTRDLRHYERLGERLKSLGLKSTAVTVMGPDTNPISPEASVRAAAVAHLDRVLECVQAFGGEVLCGPTHSAIGVFSGEGPTAEEFAAGVDTLRKAAEKAQARNVLIACEYLNRFENYMLTTAAQAVELVEAVDHPSFKMMYDSFHANIEEKDQAQAIAASARHIVHVHVSENDRGIPGTGGVNWQSFWLGIQGLKARGYDGYLTIEAFGRALPGLVAATKVWRDLFDDPYRLCREGYAFIRDNAG